MVLGYPSVRVTLLRNFNLQVVGKVRVESFFLEVGQMYPEFEYKGRSETRDLRWLLKHMERTDSERRDGLEWVLNCRETTDVPMKRP